MTGTRCFGNVVLQDLLPLGGIDTVVMNTIMYTVKKGNHRVQSTYPNKTYPALFNLVSYLSELIPD